MLIRLSACEEGAMVGYYLRSRSESESLVSQFSLSLVFFTEPRILGLNTVHAMEREERGRGFSDKLARMWLRGVREPATSHFLY